MAAALFLLQDVNLTLELGVGVNGAGLGQNLTTDNAGTVNTTEQTKGLLRFTPVV